jgi:hypothetical protein
LYWASVQNPLKPKKQTSKQKNFAKQANLELNTRPKQLSAALSALSYFCRSVIDDEERFLTTALERPDVRRRRKSHFRREIRADVAERVLSPRHFQTVFRAKFGGGKKSWRQNCRPHFCSERTDFIESGKIFCPTKYSALASTTSGASVIKLLRP